MVIGLCWSTGLTWSLPTLSMCGECLEGEIQVCPPMVGASLGRGGGPCVGSCIGKGSLEGSKCWQGQAGWKKVSEGADLGKKLGWPECGEQLSKTLGPGHLQYLNSKYSFLCGCRTPKILVTV